MPWICLVQINWMFFLISWTQFRKNWIVYPWCKFVFMRSCDELNFSLANAWFGGISDLLDSVFPIVLLFFSFRFKSSRFLILGSLWAVLIICDSNRLVVILDMFFDFLLSYTHSFGSLFTPLKAHGYPLRPVCCSKPLIRWTVFASKIFHDNFNASLGSLVSSPCAVVFDTMISSGICAR